MILGPENKRLYINFDRDRRFKTVSVGIKGKPLQVDNRLIDLSVSYGTHNTYFFFSFIWIFVTLAIHHKERSVVKYAAREQRRNKPKAITKTEPKICEKPKFARPDPASYRKKPVLKLVVNND